jgi:hypothetical protein
VAEHHRVDPAQGGRSRLNLRPGPVIALIASVLIWTVLSYALVSAFAGTNVCSILQTIEPGATFPFATFHPLTQAEMDAMTARCNRPNVGTLLISLAGYVAITVLTLRSLLSRAHPISPR